MTMRRTRNLFVQLDPATADALDEVVKMAGITKKQIIEAMLCAAAGRPHAHIGTQRATWSRYRKALRERAKP